MKQKSDLFHFLSVLLVLVEFIVAPVAHASNMEVVEEQYSGDDYMLDQVAKCDDIGGTWDSSANRCVAPKEDSENAEAAQRCQEIEDNAQRNKCFEDLALKQADVGEGSSIGEQIKNAEAADEKMTQTMSILNLLQLAIAAVVGDTNSDCYSVKILSYTGLGNSLALLGLYFLGSDKSEKLREEYERRVSQSASDGQTEAFKFLREEQLALKSEIGKEKTIHQFTAYGYTAAAIMGIVEGMKPDITGCKSKTKEDQSGEGTEGAEGAGGAEEGANAGETPNATDGATPDANNVDAPKTETPKSSRFSVEEDIHLSRAEFIKKTFVELAPYLKDAKSDLDTLFIWQERNRFARNELHSPTTTAYHNAKKLGLDRIGESGFQLKDYLIMAERLAKQAVNVVIPIAEAKKKKADWVGMLSGGFAFALRMFKPFAKTSITPYLAHPYGVAVIGGVLAFGEFKLASYDEQQMKLIDLKVQMLDEALAKFGKVNERYCLDGRDNLDDPACYCYNEDGTPNHAHDNSDICQQYWKEEGPEFTPAGSYAGADLDKNACITITGDYDPTCKCKDYKDPKTGLDACKRASGFDSFAKVPTAQAAGIPQITKTLDETYRGDSTSMGELSGAKGEQLAARQSKLKDMLVKKFNSKALKEGKKLLPTKSGTEKILQKMLNRVPANLKKAALDAGKVAPATKNAAGKALKRVRKGQYSKSRGINKKKRSRRQGGATAVSRNKIKPQKFMKKKYKYKKNDIVNNKDVSLFTIISLRYQQSGLARLFPDED